MENHTLFLSAYSDTLCHSVEGRLQRTPSLQQELITRVEVILLAMLSAIQALYYSGATIGNVATLCSPEDIANHAAKTAKCALYFLMGPSAFLDPSLSVKYYRSFGLQSDNAPHWKKVQNFIQSHPALVGSVLSAVVGGTVFALSSGRTKPEILSTATSSTPIGPVITTQAIETEKPLLDFCCSEEPPPELEGISHGRIMPLAISDNQMVNFLPISWDQEFATNIGYGMGGSALLGAAAWGISNVAKTIFTSPSQEEKQRQKEINEILENLEKDPSTTNTQPIDLSTTHSCFGGTNSQLPPTPRIQPPPQTPRRERDLLSQLFHNDSRIDLITTPPIGYNIAKILQAINQNHCSQGISKPFASFCEAAREIEAAIKPSSTNPLQILNYENVISNYNKALEHADTILDALYQEEFSTKRLLVILRVYFLLQLLYHRVRGAVHQPHTYPTMFYEKDKHPANNWRTHYNQNCPKLVRRALEFQEYDGASDQKLSQTLGLSTEELDCLMTEDKMQWKKENIYPEKWVVDPLTTDTWTNTPEQIPEKCQTFLEVEPLPKDVEKACTEYATAWPTLIEVLENNKVGRVQISQPTFTTAFNKFHDACDMLIHTIQEHHTTKEQERQSLLLQIMLSRQLFYHWYHKRFDEKKAKPFITPYDKLKRNQKGPPFWSAAYNDTCDDIKKLNHEIPGLDKKTFELLTTKDGDVKVTPRPHSPKFWISHNFDANITLEEEEEIAPEQEFPLLNFHQQQIQRVLDEIEDSEEAKDQLSLHGIFHSVVEAKRKIEETLSQQAPDKIDDTFATSYDEMLAYGGMLKDTISNSKKFPKEDIRHPILLLRISLLEQALYHKLRAVVKKSSALEALFYTPQQCYNEWRKAYNEIGEEMDNRCEDLNKKNIQLVHLAHLTEEQIKCLLGEDGRQGQRDDWLVI